jgi:hypothetical protein
MSYFDIEMKKLEELRNISDDSMCDDELDDYKGRSPFNCWLYDFSSLSIHSQISFHRKF